MKTEAEIREHIADLQWMLTQPCVCKTKRLQEACQLDRDRAEDALDALLWAVGEATEYRYIVFAVSTCRACNSHPTCNNPSLAQAYGR